MARRTGYTRLLVSQLGISGPSGFKEKALPLTEDEKKNKETVEFVEKFNKENIRWVGRFQLIPNAKTELTIPAISTAPLTGTISFQYEAKLGFGGSISFFQVSLSEPQPNKMLQPTSALVTFTT